MSKDLLIIFVKNPEAGKVKTRLAATIGNEKALDIYHQLLQRTHDITQPLSCDKVVYYAPHIIQQDLWENQLYQKALQVEGDLGIKMQMAFTEGFDAGYDRICVIGSDCYQLTSPILEQAFAELLSNDIVTGPSTDGGYYLLGMNKLYTRFFTNKKWSTSTVYADTLQDVQQMALSFASLPPLTDIDEEKDLYTMRNHS